MTDLLTTTGAGQGTARPDYTATPSRRVRRIRINPLDRPWAGHWTAVVVTPIRMPDRADVRALWQQLMERAPQTPLSCRIDDRSGAWLPVPEQDRDDHLDRTIVAIKDPAADDADSFLAASMHRLAADQSILIGVGEHSLLLLLTHQLGDGASTSTLIRALIDLDEPALAAFAGRARLSTVVGALRTQAREHGRQWWATARRRAGGDAAQVPTSAPLPAGPAEDATEVVSVRWSTADLQQISRWRSRNAKGISITAVLTAATYQAFRQAGLPMDSTGYHSLIDLRRYLPEGDFLAGNLAKSVRIDADLTDLRAIADASKEVVDTARPVPATVIGAVVGRLAGLIRRGAAPADHSATATGPVAMTFNSMPALPGLSELPWLPGSVRQYVGVGYPAGPGSLTVFAMRLREHMQVTVAFPASVMDAEHMRELLRSIPGDIDRLLT